MAKGLNLKAVLSLESKQFTKGLNNIKNQLRGFSNMLKSAFALGGIAAFSKQMVQVGADFENAMARVQAVSNATTKEFQAMQKEAQRLGATTRYTATEAANALENLTRNGLSASDATKALSGVLQLAQANAIELANAADILTNTMNAFGLSVTEVQRVNDVMSSTASHAATNINELYEAMTVAGPYAKIMGGSIEEAAAAIGVLANKGIKGSTAGKALAAMYQRLSAITPKAAKELSKYGLQMDENVVKSQDLYTTLKQLADSGLGGSVEALTNLFGKNYAGDIAQLINSTGEFNDMLLTLAQSAGTTERMFNQGIGSVQKELDTLKSMYEGLLISISQKTDGAVKGVIRLLQNLITNFKTVGGTIANLASVAVPLLTKSIVKFTTTVRTATTAMAAFKSMAGGIITVVATLVTWVGTALVGAWNRNHEAMKQAQKDLDDYQRESRNVEVEMDRLLNKLGPETNDGTVANVVAGLIEMFPDFEHAIKSAAEEAGRTKNWEKFRNVLQDIKDLQDDIANRNFEQANHDAKAEYLGQKLYGIGAGLGKGRLNSVVRVDIHDKNRLHQYNNLTSVAGAIENSLRNRYTDKYIQDIFRDISSIVTTKKSEKEAAEDLTAYFNKAGMDVGKTAEQLEEFVHTARNAEFSDWTGVLRHIALPASPVYWGGKHGDKSIANTAIENQNRADSLSTEIINKAYKQAKETLESDISNAAAKLKDKKINQSEWAKKTHDAVLTFEQTLIATGEVTDEMWSEIETLKAKYPEPKKSPVTGGGNETKGSKAKTDAEKVKDLLDGYNKGYEALENRKKAGTITDKEYDSALKDLNETTIEGITSFTNFNDILKELGETAMNEYQQLSDAYKAAKKKDADAAEEEKKAEIAKQEKALAAFKVKEKTERSTLFDFEKDKLDIQEEEVTIQFNYADSLQAMKEALAAAIENGQFDKIKDEAKNLLNVITEKAEEATKAANNMNEALAGAKAVAMFKDLQKEFQETMISSVETAAGAFDRLYRSIQDIAEVFGQDLEWEGMEKVIKLINAGVTIFETFKSVIDAIKNAEELYQQMHTKNAAKTVTENLEIAASEEIKSGEQAKDAIAGGASSVANIPYVGAALAVAAAAAVAAALMTNMNKYEKGGIVAGSSYSGDKVTARLNSGEAVLTRSQQATLFNAIASGNLGGGVSNVQFRIKGSDLISVMDNEKNKRRG